MPHVSRFKKRSSDRSGFDYFEYELVKDAASRVAAEELDTPPPSKKSLGGEGDVALGDARTPGNFGTSGASDTPSTSDNPTVYVTAAGGISPTFVHPWMRVVGSNANVNLSANPQVTAGVEGQLLTLEGVGSTITLDHGTGLNMMGSGSFLMTSGAVISFWYSSSNSVWNETSRFRP